MASKIAARTLLAGVRSVQHRLIMDGHTSVPADRTFHRLLPNYPHNHSFLSV